MADSPHGGGSSPPPAPDPQGPPSRLRDSLNAADKAAKERSNAPSGETQEEERNRRNAMNENKTPWAIILGALIVALGSILAARGMGCGGVGPVPNPALTSADAGATGANTPNPTPAPLSAGPGLTPSDTNLLAACNSTMVGKSSARWYMVSTTIDSGYTLAARLCVGNGAFRAADTARVVSRTVYISEGGHESSGTIDTSRKLSDITGNKIYVDVQKANGNTVRFENPYLVFIGEEPAFDFCAQYRGMKAPESDDLVAREIWSRCTIASWSSTSPAEAAHHRAVAQTIAQPLAAWASRSDLAALNGSIHSLRMEIARVDAKVVDKPLPPQQVDFYPGGPK